MKKPIAVTGITGLALFATACGEGGVDTGWFDENCATEVSDIHDAVEQGHPQGDALGEAVTQGPIHPPADLDNSEYEHIGLYAQDDLSGAMELEREVSSEDVFCLEPEIRDAERSQTIDTRDSEVEGDLHGDVYRVDFTRVRSPEYPDGIWIGLHRSDLPQAIEPEEDMPQECAREWWVAAEEIDLNAAGQGEPVGSHAVTRAEDC